MFSLVQKQIFIKEVRSKLKHGNIIIGGVVFWLVQSPVRYLVSVGALQFFQFTILCYKFALFIPHVNDLLSNRITIQPHYLQLCH